LQVSLITFALRRQGIATAQRNGHFNAGAGVIAATAYCHRAAQQQGAFAHAQQAMRHGLDDGVR